MRWRDGGDALPCVVNVRRGVFFESLSPVRDEKRGRGRAYLLCAQVVGYLRGDCYSVCGGRGLWWWTEEGEVVVHRDGRRKEGGRLFFD